MQEHTHHWVPKAGVMTCACGAEYLGGVVYAAAAPRTPETNS